MCVFQHSFGVPCTEDEGCVGTAKLYNTTHLLALSFHPQKGMKRFSTLMNPACIFVLRSWVKMRSFDKSQNTK